MSAQDKDTNALVEGEEQAAAAQAGELVFGETIDADTILPSTADDDSSVVTMVRLRAGQRKRQKRRRVSAASTSPSLFGAGSTKAWPRSRTTTRYRPLT
ncbi:hypothetical protein [Nocardia sp. NPDC047648]|uniref:hypothetical protein n=1 Tax=Nocardia sp. NPDC047648 TaxID=3155625 RepID=UPI0033D8FE36